MSNRTNQIVDNATTSVRSFREAQAPIANLKTALDDADKALAEALINGGVALGAQRHQIEALLEQVGLVDPAPVPEPEPVATPEQDAEATFPEGGKKARLAALESSVAALTQSVEDLKALAERHLGSRI